MFLFVKNEKAVEMSNIGVVKFKNVEIDLDEFWQIDITNIVVEGCDIEVYSQKDGTFYLLYTNAYFTGLTQVHIDKYKKVISPSTTYSGYYINQFNKHKNNIYVN